MGNAITKRQAIMPGKDRLTTLPPELRNKIYYLALVEHDEPVWSLQTPALLQVNRQIREEALAIFYGVNEFYLRIPSDTEDWPAFVDMCYCQSAHLEHVTKLTATYSEGMISWDPHNYILGFQLCSEERAPESNHDFRIDASDYWDDHECVEDAVEEVLMLRFSREFLRELRIRVSVPRVVEALYLLAAHCEQALYHVELTWDYGS